MKTLNYEEAKKLVEAYHHINSQLGTHQRHASMNRMPPTVQAEAVRWANKLFQKLEFQILGKTPNTQFIIKDEDMKDFKQHKDHLPLALLSLVYQYFTANVYSQSPSAPSISIDQPSSKKR